LNWHHFEVHYLPGYSPDFNPIERLWLRLKADFFSDFIAKSPDELTQRLCHALTSFMNDPKKVASQCALRGWVIIAKRLRQPRFHANFGRIFERPKFRPCFHA